MFTSIYLILLILYTGFIVLNGLSDPLFYLKPLFWLNLMLLLINLQTGRRVYVIKNRSLMINRRREAERISELIQTQIQQIN